MIGEESLAEARLDSPWPHLAVSVQEASLGDCMYSIELENTDLDRPRAFQRANSIGSERLSDQLRECYIAVDLTIDVTVSFPPKFSSILCMIKQ